MEVTHVLAVASLSLDIDSTSSSSSSSTTSSSPSSPLTSLALDAVCDTEAEARSTLFCFPLDCVGGEEDRERGREETEVAGEGALLELATAITVDSKT